jgi:hypothetical protein
MHTRKLFPFLSLFLLFVDILSAQDKPAQTPAASISLEAYDLNREVTLTGTVVANSAASKNAPAGPRVSLQTPSGIVDIHLGDARLLAANQFTTQPGDTLRIVGENIAFSGGSQFVARIVQKGSRAVLLRNTRGFPIFTNAPRGSADPAKQGSAL